MKFVDSLKVVKLVTISCLNFRVCMSPFVNKVNTWQSIN